MKRLVILFIVLIVGSCDLQGPTGPEGPKGEQGPVGPEGEDGKDGTTNMHSETFSISTDNTEKDEGVALNAVPVPEITQAVVDSGTVKVEYQAIENAWFALPWTFGKDYSNNLEVDETIEVNYGYEEGTLYIAHISSYSSILDTDILEGPFKLTVIYPEESGAKQKARPRHIVSGSPMQYFQNIN